MLMTKEPFNGTNLHPLLKHASLYTASPFGLQMKNSSK